MSAFTALGEVPVIDVRSHDAVVVIPGIMGSVLVDKVLGKRIWGVDRAVGYAFRWQDRRLMSALAVTEEERAGKTGRVEAERLIGVPQMVPAVGGLEPCRSLLRALREVLAHPDAVLKFPYDWRLGVTFNARVLAERMHRHLEDWRRRTEHARARPPGEPEARLVLVAYSMGGLVVRALSAISGALDEVRAIVTIGTPFHGSLAALELLANGEGAHIPLAHDRLRHIARTMPGVYDLLPTYHCLIRDNDVKRLSPSDIASVGGDPELASDAAASRRLDGLRLPGLRPIVGTHQTTPTSVELRDGAIVLHPFGHWRTRGGRLRRDRSTGAPLRVDYGGDGRVFVDAASPVGTEPTLYAQQHGGLPEPARSCGP